MSDDPLVLKVKRLRPDARLPTKANPTDAGFDLFAVEPKLAQGGHVHRIPTGIAIELPPGWGALILGRSSLAQTGITPLGGLIDPGFRGEWIVNLWVPVPVSFDIQPGNKVAQFVVLPVPKVLIEEANGLSASERGEKAFGSSGR